MKEETSMKCDCCDNVAEYIFTECGDEKHFCESCAVSYFGLYKMGHVKCDYCGKPCLENSYEEDNYHRFCSVQCAIRFCIELYGEGLCGSEGL